MKRKYPIYFFFIGACFIILSLFTGCNTKETKEKINEAKEIAEQYIQDKYDIKANATAGKLKYENRSGWFFVGKTATGDAYVTMQNGKETFKVLVSKNYDDEVKCYDNRQITDISTAIKEYVKGFFHLDDCIIELFYGYEHYTSGANHYPHGETGFLTKLYTNDNLKDVLEGYLQIVVKTYNNDYLEKLTEQESKALYDMFKNTDYSIAVLNHDDKQNIHKTDISSLRATTQQAEEEVKENCVYLKSAVLLTGESYNPDDVKENNFILYSFDVKEYDGIKYVLTNKEDTFSIKKENISVNPKNWDGYGVINAKVLSDVYSIPVKDLENRTGNIYIFFPISKIITSSKKRICFGYTYTKEGQKQYEVDVLYYDKIGDYYRINANSIYTSGGENVKFVILGDN